MIREIRIKNYKSIQKLKMDIGRFTVLIGENGSGKSNILEAVALASAAGNDKLDNEFISSRGIRATEPKFMRSAFDNEYASEEIYINLIGDADTSFECRLQNDNEPYSEWKTKDGNRFDSYSSVLKNFIDSSPDIIDEILESIKNEKLTENLDKRLESKFDRNFAKNFKRDMGFHLNRLRTIQKLNLQKFLIYSPENFALRVFEKEGQIQPLGINGEGLFKLLKVLGTDKNTSKFELIKEKLKIIDWFEDFEIPDQLSERENLIRIKDRYIDDEFSYFDQRSSNEGFLFMLFYFALFISDKTPDFFAVDNIDESLNPKLCWHLTKELVDLGRQFNKQAIVTTHNPAILDGLNLNDSEQKLFVVYRNKVGHTKIKQIEKPKTPEGQESVRLSEAFLRGYIGGLPKGF